MDLVHEGAANHEDELLDGMVEIRLDVDLVLGRRDRNQRGVLDLVNQVLVTLADEAATLLDVQVDVVAPEHHGRNGRRIDREGSIRGCQEPLTIEQTLKGSKGQIDANGMILKG